MSATDRATALKSDQASKKQKVTVAVNKLKDAIQKKKDISHIETFSKELETYWFEFETIHCEYVDHVSNDASLKDFETVNGLGLEDYREAVYKKYDEAICQYEDYKKHCVEAGQCIVYAKLDGKLKRLDRLCRGALTSLSDMSCDKFKLLNFVKQDIEPFVDDILRSLSELTCTEEIVRYQNSVDSYVEKLDELKLECSLSLSVTGHKVYGESEALGEAKISSFSHPTSFAQQSSKLPVSHTDLGLTTDVKTSYPQSSTLVSNLQNFAHTAGANLPGSSGAPSFTSMSVPSSSVEYNALLGASLGASLTASSLSQGPPVVASGSLPSPYATYDFGLYSQNATHSVPSSLFTGGIPFPSVTMPTAPTTSLPHPSTWQTQFGGTVPSVTSLPSYGNLTHAPGPGYLSQTSGSGRLSDIHVKRSSLPEFSGHRKDWPEFKAVWRELAESAYGSKAALAYELKKSLKGAAKDRVKNIYITRPEAYDLMWLRLSEHYDDCSASVQSALEGLHRLKPVKDDDFKGVVHLVDEVEAAYAQLNELGKTDILSMREIDQISELLPSNTRMLWVRLYHELDQNARIRPLDSFMQFLFRERASVVRLAEQQPKKKVHQSGSFATSNDKSKPAANGQKGKPCCVVHKETSKHKTSECSEFKKLPLDDKYNALRNFHACFRCFGYHRRDQCKSKVYCDLCKKHGHLTLMCKQNSPEASPESTSASSHTAKTPTSCSLYAIYQVSMANSRKEATVFCDNGSNSSYITHRAAERLGAVSLGEYTLDVTTMGNVETEYKTCLYEIVLKTKTGCSVPIQAFGMREITSSVSMLDVDCLRNLFPNRDPRLLQRKSTQVDILLGSDFFGLHPKHEICKAGDHLSIMQGELGICLQGCHPDLKEETAVSSSMVRILHSSLMKTDCHNLVLSVQHPEFNKHVSQMNCVELSVKTESNSALTKSELGIRKFIEGEELATEVNPKCGGCKCSKCPTVGHTYSFKEEKELMLIRENLRYDADQKFWVTKYPWLANPETLPDNYSTALATLKSTEVTLGKDPLWAEKYSEQIKDMLDREVARCLSEDELRSWNGPKFYISHLAVKNTHSQSTPVRIVFNSSQVCHGVSLNSVLAKGPDAYLNNLLGLLLRWREEQVAIVGDIKKMFHSVHLETLEQHCHRFLWRDLDTTKKPDVFVMTRVNMGDRPAPAICTEALYMTANLFETESPLAAEVIRQSTYVDDILDSFPGPVSAQQVVADVEKMLAKGGFKVKCWLSNQNVVPCSESQDSGVSLLKTDGQDTRVLGVSWSPKLDVMTFKVVLNFSPKRKGERTGPNLKASEVPAAIPTTLTRRLVLQQVMMLFDPLGLICPFTLLAKLHLRETWAMGLGWDESLPESMREKWLQFFTRLFELEQIEYDRCLHPPSTVASGPSLIIFSDASDAAYGFAAYARWQLENGQVWCRLIMAKSRIAPLRKLSTPQMELNAAVLSKRGRKVIEKEMRLQFDKVLHIVDSETVLNMIHKTSTRFKIYEGVRVGEIQSATGGDMSSWAWLPGEHNSADLLSRGCYPDYLKPDSTWWTGPEILYKPMDEWQLKFGLQRDCTLPGEKKVVVCSVADARKSQNLSNCIDFGKYSDVRKLVWVVALLIGIAQAKSFKGVCCKVTPDLLRQAESKILHEVQRDMSHDLTQKGGKYTPLKPSLRTDGLWVVGSRLQQYNPMCPESDAQVLLPSKHVVTRLLMKNAHETGGHRGRDATLARFRQKYWTPYGSKIAGSVKASCQLCKLRDPEFLGQEMGSLPDSRLKPAPAFTNVMLDLFGPYKVRGEVNKRSTGKAYGVIFTDMVMRAVHIEAVFGYDSNSFLLALSRFASVRGWPEKIYSDPGSQLVGVERELKEAWKRIDHNELRKRGAENGLTWVFGPADSPWYQGAVESLVKSAKRSIDFAIHNQRLSPIEFLTLCSEVSNVMNERPIGTMPSSDAEISILTPNCLLMGRATSKNPGGWQPQEPRLSMRYQVVQNLVDSFWKRWTELCAPALIVQRKWHTSHRNLKPGDVVIVSDKNTFRGEYRLGLVRNAIKGQDGKVRKVSLMYKNFKIQNKLHKATEIVVTRAVQRLALLVPVDGDGV